VARCDDGVIHRRHQEHDGHRNPPRIPGGGIPSALVVGFVYRYVKKTDFAALTEPLGTVFIGATISTLVVAPYLGKAFTVVFWWVAFAASSVPGSILGYVVLKALRMSGLSDRLDFESER